ncbi:MAG: cupin domain-containing protein [Candidatus Thiodiazotropha sp. 6PLUC4]
MKAKIKHQDLENEFYTDELCHIIEVSNSNDDPGLSIARARVEAGVTTRWHRLKETIERYLIVSGRGRVEIDDQKPVEVGAGDVVIIPPMCRQRITNYGTDDLIFYAICSPRFLSVNYLDSDSA